MRGELLSFDYINITESLFNLKTGVGDSAVGMLSVSFEFLKNNYTPKSL